MCDLREEMVCNPNEVYSACLFHVSPVHFPHRTVKQIGGAWKRSHTPDLRVPEGDKAGDEYNQGEEACGQV